ncbi:MAG TPA: hypothetical protein DEB46_02080, partial [Myxococcales bacterium]|nr:hypothetical protein [Myxococcales bacterium]
MALMGRLLGLILLILSAQGCSSPCELDADCVAPEVCFNGACSSPGESSPPDCQAHGDCSQLAV